MLCAIAPCRSWNKVVRNCLTACKPRFLQGGNCFDRRNFGECKRKARTSTSRSSSSCCQGPDRMLSLFISSQILCQELTSDACIEERKACTPKTIPFGCNRRIWFPAVPCTLACSLDCDCPEHIPEVCRFGRSLAFVQQHCKENHEQHGSRTVGIQHVGPEPGPCLSNRVTKKIG